MEQNVLDLRDRASFRAWLAENCRTETECWLVLRRGRPADDGEFYYIDAVEEALCFGWIDSTLRVVDGERRQRFSPRRKNSPWSELNKERVRRLESLGLMTDAGRAALPPMGKRSFRISAETEAALKKARVWTKFNSFPPLYRRVRAYNVDFYMKRAPERYAKSLAHLIAETAKGNMFGEWDDYGRLSGE